MILLCVLASLHGTAATEAAEATPEPTPEPVPTAEPCPASCPGDSFDSLIFGEGAWLFDLSELDAYTKGSFALAAGDDISELLPLISHMAERHGLDRLVLCLSLSPSGRGEWDTSGADTEKIGDMEAYLSRHGEDFPQPRGEAAASLDLDGVRAVRESCEENGVGLTVLLLPLYSSRWESLTEESVRGCLTALAETVDYYDFTYSSLSRDGRYFYDAGTFRRCAASMMLSRIYGGELYFPSDFGAHVTKESAQGHADALYSADGREEIDYYVNLPVLMYHDFTEKKSGSDDVSAPVFRRQLEYVRYLGYTPVSLAEVIDYVWYGGELPDKPVLITIDDGYMSNYTIAYPILRELSVKAAIFVIGSSVGRDTYKDTGEAIIPHFGFDEAREMMSSGLIEVQSHTFDMHQSRLYEPEDARENVLPFPDESAEDYADALRRDAELFAENYEAGTGGTLYALAYPCGKYCEDSERVFHALGYRLTLSTAEDCANTLVRGLPQSLYALGRLAMSDTMFYSTIREHLAQG